MAIYNLDVDDVCTHEDLAAEVGGSNELDNLTPDEYEGNSKPMRERALRDTLKALARRTPPILEVQLADPTDLREAVIYGTLAHLYRMGMSTTDGVHGTKHDIYNKKFESEVLGLNPSLSTTGARANAYSIQISRR